MKEKKNLEEGRMRSKCKEESAHPMGQAYHILAILPSYIAVASF